MKGALMPLAIPADPLGPIADNGRRKRGIESTAAGDFAGVGDHRSAHREHGWLGFFRVR